jgi:hypothetical protein
MRYWRPAFLTALISSSFFIGAQASAQGIEKKPAIQALNADLQLSHDQAQKLDPRFNYYFLVMLRFHHDASLTLQEKAKNIADQKKALVADVRPFLTTDQVGMLENDLAKLNLEWVGGSKKFLIPLFSVTYEKFFPSDATTRSIFGPSPSSIQFGITELEQSPNDRTRLSFGFETFGTGTSSNKLFIGSPDAAYEYRVPVAGHFTTFAKVFAGPSYMDYSFDTPNGQHFGAKRIGLNGGVQVGLRYGRAQLTAAYRAFTQPAGIDFNGIQLDLTYVVVHF